MPTKRNANGMTPLQQLVADEYLIDLQKGPAYRRAGGKAKCPTAAAIEILNDPQVDAYVQAKMLERSKRTEITADDVIRELARLGLHDVRKLFDSNGRMKAVTDLDDDIAAAVQSIKVVTRQLPRQKDEPVEVEYVHEIKLHDKVKPLELIGKHLGKRLGQWNDRTEHDVAPDSPLAALVAAINGGKHTLQPGDDDA